jgi:hypothetical protein
MVAVMGATIPDCAGCSWTSEYLTYKSEYDPREGNVITWSFDADYFTACNCDWGCPCDFNAASTEGRCMGWGVWSIGKGRSSAA